MWGSRVSGRGDENKKAPEIVFRKPLKKQVMLSIYSFKSLGFPPLRQCSSIFSREMPLVSGRK